MIASDSYVGLFSNQYGEHWRVEIDTFNKVGRLFGDELGPGESVNIIDGHLELDLILNEEELLWLQQCWEQATGVPLMTPMWNRLVALAGELRSLTPGKLILDGDKPYIVCQAGSTKNKKIARQYVDVQLASSLRSHVATKSPQAQVFNLPSEYDMADMIRDDLADVRKARIKDAK